MIDSEGDVGVESEKDVESEGHVESNFEKAFG